MKAIAKLLIHTAIGGLAAGLLTIPAGAPITAKTVLYPAIGSALSSLFSLLSSNPFKH